MAKKYCPICEEENGCKASASEHGDCWCFTEEFPDEIFKLIPEESRKKYCICKKCLNKYREEKKI